MSEATKLSNLIKEAEEVDLLKAVMGVREPEETDEDYLEQLRDNDGNWPDRNR